MNNFIKKLILIFVVTTIFSGKIIAKDSDLSFGILGTDNAWNSYIDLLFPLIDKEKSILFIEPNLSMTAKSLFESSSNQSSIGVGYRKLSTNLKSIFGINVFYDVKNNQLGNNFQQIGIGFEYFVSLFSIKANGYIPISKDEYFIMSKYDGFIKNYIYKNYYYCFATKGFDSEIGCYIPIPKKFGKLNVYGGYYKFVANKLQKDISGLNAKIEYEPISMLKLSYLKFQDKNFNSTGWQVEANLSIPFDFKKLLQSRNPLSLKKRDFNLKDNLKQKVQRNYQINTFNSCITHFDEPLKDALGNILHFTVASPLGNGDGTFENPANIVNGTNLAINKEDEKSVLLLLGGNYTIDTQINLINLAQRDILFCGYQEIEYLGANLSNLTKTNPIITFKNNSCFNITGTSTATFTISSLEFISSDNSQTAFNIKNSSNSFIFNNNNFNNFDTALNIENSLNDAYMYNNIFENNNLAVFSTNSKTIVEQNIFSNNKLAISLYNCVMAKISSNDIHDNGTVIKDISTVDTQIYSNYMYNNEIVIENELSVNTQIYSNYLYNNGCAIKNTSTTAVAIYNNDFYRNLSVLTSNFSSSTYVFSNYIKNSVDTAILSSSDKYLTVYDNTIENNNSIAIQLQTSQSSFISSNTIQNNSGTSISVLTSGNTSDTTINNNTILNYKQDAIHLYGNSEDVSVESNINIYANTISSSPYENTSAVVCSSLNTVLISSNTFEINDTAIKVSNSSQIVVSTNMFLQGNTAISISDSSSITVECNELYETTQGIKATSTNSLLVSSNAISNVDEGIYLSNTKDAQVKDNTISGSKIFGIYVDTAPSLILQGNAVYFCDCSLGAVVLNNLSNSTITMNNLLGNSEVQMKINNASNLNISNNYFETSSKAHGLYLNNCSNTILNQNIFFKKDDSSTYFGLFLKGSTTFNGLSGSNTFKENAFYWGDVFPVNNYETNVKAKDSFN